MNGKIAALLGMTILVATGCTSANPHENHVQGLQAEPSWVQEMSTETILSLQVVGGLPGTSGSSVIPNRDPRGTEIIAKVIGWIHSAKPAGGQTEYGKHGYPPVIDIKARDGVPIAVEPAYDCVVKTEAGGSSSKTCTPADGEVVISRESARVRLEAPDLYGWLQGGWKAEGF